MMRYRLDLCVRITLTLVLSTAGVGCGRAQLAPMARGWHGKTQSLATDAPALRRAVRDHGDRDSMAWFVARRDREPAVIVGSLGPAHEQSVTTTFDNQAHSSINVRDQVHSRTVHVRRRSVRY